MKNLSSPQESATLRLGPLSATVHSETAVIVNILMVAASLLVLWTLISKLVK